MRICVLAGGVGSARLLAGLVTVVDASDLTVVVNTGDDDRIQGLHVSPDIDTVLYHLAGLTQWDRGWGMTDESFVAHERYKDLASKAGVDADLQDWFQLGDRDLATHMLRTRLLDLGSSLTDATAALARALGIGVRVLPMTDQRVATRLRTAGGEVLDFQTYFVRRRHDEDVAEVIYEGASDAAAPAAVLDAITSADVVLIPPSNPLLSVAPILAVPGVDAAVRRARVVAVSPIVGGKALKGPADRVLASMGFEASAAGVAAYYEGLVNVFVVDEADRGTSLDGVDVLVCDTIMTGPDAAARLCKEIITYVS